MQPPRGRILLHRPASIVMLLALALASLERAVLADAAGTRRPISELTPVAHLHLAKTVDWVAVGEDAVWVGTTGPDGVAAIDPRANALIATVPLPGEPCAGLALGFGALWVPLCARPNTLARIDLTTHAVHLIAGAGPADREGGITVGRDGVWLVTAGSVLARVDPDSLRITHRVPLPPGSLNPLSSEGLIWVTQSAGARVTVVEASSGKVVASVRTGPRPRFLAAGAGSVWTLNQGDGTLTHIDAHSRRLLGTTPLQTPGHGGDIQFGQGVVWTTMTKVPLSATDARTGELLCQWVGPGGDSLGVSAQSLWLTDYSAGDVERFDAGEVLRHCPTRPEAGRETAAASMPVALPQWVLKTVEANSRSAHPGSFEEATYDGQRVFEFIRADVADTGSEHILYSAEGKELCKFGGFAGHVTSGACDLGRIRFVRKL